MTKSNRTKRPEHLGVKAEYDNIATAKNALRDRLRQAPVPGADETLKAYDAELLKLRLRYAKLTGETLL